MRSWLFWSFRGHWKSENTLIILLKIIKHFLILEIKLTYAFPTERGKALSKPLTIFLFCYWILLSMIAFSSLCPSPIFCEPYTYNSECNPLYIISQSGTSSKVAMLSLFKCPSVIYCACVLLVLFFANQNKYSGACASILLERSWNSGIKFVCGKI